MNLDLSGFKPTDDDQIDIDIKDSAVKTMLVNHDGQLNYNPGNDISMGDVLTNNTWGEGNDMAFVWTQNGTINDKDTLSDAYVQNSGNFEQNGDAEGGDANAKEGIQAGGGGGEGGSYAKANGGDGDEGGNAWGGKGEGGDGDGGDARSYADGGFGKGGSAFSVAAALAVGGDGGEGGNGFGAGAGLGGALGVGLGARR